MVKIGIGDAIRIGRLLPEQQRDVYVILSIVTICLAPFLILLGGIILAAQHNNSAVCTSVLLWPIVAIGLFLLAVLISACCFAKLEKFFLVFLCVLVFIFATVALLAFVVFGYIAVGGIDYGPVKVREYNLQDYSGWLRGRMADPLYWDTISACLRDKHACKRMRQLVRDPKTGIFVPDVSSNERWVREHDPDAAPPVITPIESGCCKPPSSCAFTYVNGTTWEPTPGASAVETDVDCSRWSNNQQKLCFHCDSCKAGLLDDIKKGWSIAVIFLIVALIGHIVFPCLALVAAIRDD